MTTQSTPEGPGSVSGAPNPPEGFTDTFTSRYVDTGELPLHAVIGGEVIMVSQPEAVADMILTAAAAVDRQAAAVKG
jgi:hypothetical protein